MQPKRNILFILADQFRWDCIRACGNAVIQTPNLDMLAAEGTRFTKHFVQAAPCGPSRMCIYTSRYMCSTRSTNNMTPLADADENVAMDLKRHGHTLQMLGYNDYAVDPRVLPEGDPRKTSLNYDNFLPGVDVVLKHEHHSPEYFAMLRGKGYPEELCDSTICYRYDVPPDGPGEHLPLHYPALYTAEDSETEFVTNCAIEAIKKAAPGWVVNVNYIKPHPPRICPAPYHAMYDPADMPPANRRHEELEDPHPYYRLMHAAGPALEEEQDLRETRACYYGMVSEVDACLGRLFQAIKDAGEWDTTLIVVSSDHGEYLGDHWMTDKAHFYDETMRVPLIVRDPSPEADATRGSAIAAFLESIDIAPTLLEYVGTPIPDRYQGRSLLGLLRGREGAQPRREIHFEYDFRDRFLDDSAVDLDECVLWVLRDDDYKYVQFGREDMPPLFFDLRTDPGEHENLAEKPEHQATVARYCQRMLRWRMKHEDQRMEHWATALRKA